MDAQGNTPQEGAPARRWSSELWRFGRADVRTLRVLMVLAAAAYLGLALAPRVVSWASGDPLVWSGHLSDLGPTLPGVAGPGATVRYANTVEWTIAHAGTGQWLASLAATMITSVLLVVGLGLSWKLLSLTAHGDPFSRQGLRYVRGIALTVTAYGVLMPFTRPLFDLLVVLPSSLTPELVSEFSVFDFGPLMIGFLMLAITECFRIGAQLRTEVDGLV